MTVWDATNARKYTWDVDFVKLTPRLRNILNKIQVSNVIFNQKQLLRVCAWNGYL